jgi:hypothetical protein
VGRASFRIGHGWRAARRLRAGGGSRHCLLGRVRPSGILGNGSFGGAAGSGSQFRRRPCEHGAVRDCHVKIGEHEGIVTCYVGKQACNEGVWGPCTDGVLTNKPGVGTESDGGMNTASYGEPTFCKNNPCDPYCKIFDETPEAGIRADAGVPLYTWPTGILSDLPSGLVKKGSRSLQIRPGLPVQHAMHERRDRELVRARQMHRRTGAELEL